MNMADADTDQSRGRFRLPDPPRREADEVTQFDQLGKTGNVDHLIQHFGKPETTLVEANRRMVASPRTTRHGSQAAHNFEGFLQQRRRAGCRFH